MKTNIFFLIAFGSTMYLSASETNQNRNYSQYQTNEQNSYVKRPLPSITDDEITENVARLIQSNWFSKGYPNVTFDVKNGNLNLRGVVESDEEKNNVEESAKKIGGVKSVNSDIRVGLNPSTSNYTAANDVKTANPNSTETPAKPKDTGATDKDKMINTKIRERLLKWSPKGYETFILTTNNGVVVVTGNVEKVSDIQKISNDIKSVDGVKSVTNQVTIKRQ